MGVSDFNFDLPPGETFRPSPERVRAIAALLPPDRFCFAPSVTDRAAWSPWRQHSFGQRVLKVARELAAQPSPELNDAVYLDGYQREDVTRINQLVPALRRRQTAFLLAEAIFDTGEFLPPLIDDIHLCARLSSWIYPGNDRDCKTFKGETTDNDLASCRTAVHFAFVDLILGPRLDPALLQLIRGELDRRFFRPLRERVETGRDLYWWLIVKHNWNSVCLSCYAQAAVAALPTAEDRAWWLALTESLAYHYIDGFTDDGLCLEGVGYWNYGFMHYIILAEVLRIGTRNTVDLLDTPKARRIARFPDRVEIQPGAYPSFADCALDAKPGSWARAWLDNRRDSTPDEFVEPARIDPFDEMKIQFTDEALIWMFCTHDPLKPLQRRAAMNLRDWFEWSGFLVCRSAPSTRRKFAATLLGGHNGVNHNHNDLGTFTVLLDGKALIYDPGTEVYSMRTFSDRRYESQLLNSYGHPVPRVGGQLQSAGSSSRALVVAKEFSVERDRLVFDLRSAYKVPTLRKLEREFIFDRRGDGCLTIIDTAEFAEPTVFESALITSGVVTENSGVVRLSDGDTAIKVEYHGEGSALVLSRDTINLPPHPTRVAIATSQPVTRTAITLRIRPD